jgi:hypothetical protein
VDAAGTAQACSCAFLTQEIFMHIRGSRTRAAAAMLAGVIALGTAGVGAPVAAAQSSPAGPVSSTPASGTPELAPTGSTEQVRQIVQCGNTMYAVGKFTAVKQKDVTHQVNNVISFGATAPFTLTGWAPDVNGTVNSIAFVGGNCADAYLGGKFTSINGTPALNIAEVDTTTGQVVPSFGHSASAQVETLLGYNSHLITGGYFTSINGSKADAYMASLNPVTGKDDGFVHLGISGHYVYPGVQANPTRIYNQQLSHGGTLELVEGDFTSVGGLPRQQIFMLNLSGITATVTGWSSPEFDGSKGNLPNGYPYQCKTNEPFYIQAASWSPDDSTVYIATTGYRPYNVPAGRYPLTGLCDAAAAFPSAQTEVNHEWVNYTGCDSLFSTAADESTAYFGGHERWSQNVDGCDRAGPGAISAPGMEGLSPATGNLAFNPSHARGLGADDMLITDSGLWIASDNEGNVDQCGHKFGFAGICLLPYS